jgi:ribonucleoside-diphosphate reductase alpha chain
MPDGQLAACFVLPVEDNIRSIFTAILNTALIHKSGGGTGFNFSKLRPKNSKVKSTNGVASGPVSFMSAFDKCTDVIKQGGVRRGANMGVLRIDHPDIIEFINCKESDNAITNFNLSVAITDKFMEAVEGNKMFDLINPATGAVELTVKARNLWCDIIDHAWKNGDPGILFIDEINKHNPHPELGNISATNPCGEQPLFDNESCNLGSINLAKMLKEEPVCITGKSNSDSSRLITKKAIDWKLLEETVKTAVRFLDNVIDANCYPLPEIEQASKFTRKIGLGVMGFADMLAQLEIAYDSGAGQTVANEVMKAIQVWANQASKQLKEERGGYFALGITRPNDGKYRNATRTTIAPTGSISGIAGCWGGIEPYFSLYYEKHVMDGTILRELNPYLQAHLRQLVDDNKIALADLTNIINRVRETGSVQDIEYLPEKTRRIFKVASEISPSNHLAIQATFQQCTDNAVSKTINLPNSASVDDIEEIYMKAWKFKLKGVTVYRDGCKATQVYYSPKKETEAKIDIPTETTQPEKTKKGTPSIATGTRIRKKTGCGQLYVHINRNESGDPIEIFADLGKAGGCPSAFTEGLGRLASLSLKHGATLEEVRDELIEIKCSRDCGLGPNYIGSCLDGTAKAIHDCLQTKGGSDGTEAKVSSVHPGDNSRVTKDTSGPQSGACPSCGGTLDYVEGCRGGKCRNPACDYYTCG